MIKALKNLFTAPATKQVLSAVKEHTKTNQPRFAPAAFGGAVVTGAIGLCIGTFLIFDCVRYQKDSGECNEIIHTNVPLVLTSASTIVGSWGAFNTFNSKLHRVPKPVVALPAKELVVKEEPKLKPPAEVNVAEKVKTFKVATEVAELRKAGLSQAKVAKQLGISIYAVRKLDRKASVKKSNRRATAKNETTA